MKRFGMVTKVRPGKLDQYTELHANPWPEVLKVITDCNIRNYSIYLKGDQLFSYFEYVGDDFDADMKKMAAAPVTQKWWDVCKPCLEPVEPLAEGEVWAPMEEIFCCE